jgi:hypothetical protein
MPNKQAWLPNNHEALNNQATQTVSHILANKVRLGFSDNTAQGNWFSDVFDVSYTRYITAFAAWKNPATRTKIISAELEEAQKAFIPDYRQLYTGFLKESPFVTNADLSAMGLPERNESGNNPTPVEIHTPYVHAHAGEPRQVIVTFGVSETSRAKPAGQHGMEFVYTVSDTPPVGIEELQISVFATRPPLILTFSESQRGKKLYFAVRWENTRGKKGPWSEIFSIIIP